MENNFNWAKALGFGLLLWLIMFLLSAIALALSISLNVWAMLILAVIAGFLAYGFALNAEPDSYGQAFSYGLVWLILGVLLDLLISRQFESNLFNVWTYWLGYAFILFAPLTAAGSHQTTTHSHV